MENWMIDEVKKMIEAKQELAESGNEKAKSDILFLYALLLHMD